MGNKNHYSFLNGQPAISITAFDRGLFYGQGLFETMRVQRGEIPLWSFHLSRLQNGSARLKLPVDSERIVQYRDQLLLAAPEDGVLKLVVTAGEGGRGYAAPEKMQLNYLLQWSPLPEQQSEVESGVSLSGISLWVCDQRLADSPSLAGMKHLNRLEQVLARAEQPMDRYPEGLMLDSSGSAIEGISSNLFCRHGEKWFTPILNHCGVAGVMREYLISQYPVIQKRISLQELASMDELFVCNAVRGIWPVVSIEGVGHWSIGEGTRQWQRQLQGEFTCFG